MGKSLYISRKVEELNCALKSPNRLRSATLHGPELSRDHIVKVIQNVSTTDTDNLPCIFRVDVSERVSSAILSFNYNNCNTANTIHASYFYHLLQIYFRSLMTLAQFCSAW